MWPLESIHSGSTTPMRSNGVGILAVFTGSPEVVFLSFMQHHSISVKTPIYYGWWVVLASFVGTAVCITPVVFLSFGAFIIPLTAEFGWDRGEISLAISILAITLAVSMPIAGVLIDRLGVRKVVIPCMCLLAALIGAWSLNSGKIVYLYTIAALIGIVGAGSSTVGYSKSVTQWFQRRRGLALGIAVAGIGAGATITPLIAQWLIEKMGWRAAFCGLAIYIVIIGLPIVTLLLRDSPASAGHSMDDGILSASGSETREIYGPSRATAAKTREFWTIAGVFFLVAVALHGIQIHLIPALVDKGLSGRTAAGAAALMGVTALVFRVISGYLFDRIFAPRVGALAFSFPIIAVFILLFGENTVVLMFCAVLLGIATGAEGDLLAYLTGRYFGTRAFGEIFGYFYSAFIIASAVGPSLMGFAHARTGSYDALLWANIAVFAVGVGLLLSLPKFPTSMDA